MKLKIKEIRVFRRYNSPFRRAVSLFMLMTVLPMLTGLDLVAYDLANEAINKDLQNKFDHQQLCEIAPQYLQGHLIPRLRQLSTKLEKIHAEDTNGQFLISDIKFQIESLNSDLKRIKLALLDNFSKLEKENLSASAPLRENIKKSKIANHKSKILKTINHLQTYCKQLGSSNENKRTQAASRILKLTEPKREAKPLNLAATRKKPPQQQSSNIQLNRINNPMWEATSPAASSIASKYPNKFSQRSKLEELKDSNRQQVLPPTLNKSQILNPSSLCDSASLRENKLEELKDSNRQQVLPPTLAKSKTKDLKSKINPSPAPCPPKTILDLSLIPHPPIQLVAAGDVLASLLTEVTDPNSTGPPTVLDTAFTPPLTVSNAEVIQLADDLKTPVKIFEHFRNTYVYEPYFGAVKGTAKTLDEQAGNDVDIASALISVLREAGVACRYVYGTIRLSPEQAASWLAVDAGQVEELLAENHIPFQNTGTPGVDDILIDHVWVKAYIDYLPYAGATDADNGQTIDLVKTGDFWIDIDPSFKQHEFSDRRDMEAALGMQTENFLTNIRSQASRNTLPNNFPLTNGSNGENSDDNVTLLPQTYILNEVIGLANPLAQFLAQNDLTTANVFRQKTIANEVYGLLPSTDYYTIHARGTELRYLKLKG